VSIFIYIFLAGSKRRIFAATEYVQGHSWSMILVPVESAYATSFMSDIVILVMSCAVSEIQQLMG